MQKAAILTDSTCDLPTELQQNYKIEILNYRITLNGRSYTERLDFTPQQYYRMLETARSAPSTTPIPPDDFVAAFERYMEEEYTDVIVVTVASSVSQTNNNAHLALARFYRLPPATLLRIHILDSELFAMAYGYPICVAAAMLQQGTDATAVVGYMEDCFSRIELVFAAYTCKYLKMSGRTKGFAAFVGDLFRIRPVMSYIDGVSKAEESVKGDKNVIPAMCDYTLNRIDKRQT